MDCFSVCIFRAEQHFTDVMLGEEFMALSLQQVCCLISSDKLTVSTEEKVTPVVFGPEDVQPVVVSNFNHLRFSMSLSVT